MKQILFSLTLLLTLNSFSFAQNRSVARGAEPGELYLACGWYGIYNPTGMYYDTLQTAIYRITENGKKLTIQYDISAFANPADTVVPYSILADATPGVIYAKTYYANSGFRTSLWVSFDYGKNWIFREENSGQRHYYSANFEGIIYRTSSNAFHGAFRSDNYGTSFTMVNNISFNANESGFDTCDFFFITGSANYSWSLYHTYDRYQTCIIIPIDSQFVFGCRNICPDVYRGGVSGEVYVSSWFPDNKYRVSFSADTSHTFRHVYVSDVYPIGGNSYPFFMSDREQDVFYIIKAEQVEDFNPWGHHTKVCIEYYRDYGETLVATYCHDLHKNYGKICEAINDLVLEKINDNSVLLTWSEPESSLPVENYHIYRNGELLSSIINTTYTDENLLVGNYEYYVISRYVNGCISDSSSHVIVNIEVGINEREDVDKIIIYPNPTTGKLRVTSYELRVTSIEIFDVYGRSILSLTSLMSQEHTLDIMHLKTGIYFIKITTEKGMVAKKIVKQ